VGARRAGGRTPSCGQEADAEAVQGVKATQTQVSNLT
jgi:hypothetical protein